MTYRKADQVAFLLTELRRSIVTDELKATESHRIARRAARIHDWRLEHMPSPRAARALVLAREIVEEINPADAATPPHS
jgi:hypothetical protein